MRRYLRLIAVVMLLSTLLLAAGCVFGQRAAEMDERVTTLEEKVAALEQQVEALVLVEEADEP